MNRKEREQMEAINESLAEQLFMHPESVDRGDFPEADGIMIGDQIWSRWYGPNTDGQYVVTYAAPSARAEGQAYSFDLKDFIDDAVANGAADQSAAGTSQAFVATWYLTDVFAGFEAWSGSDIVGITETFTCVVQ